MSATSVAAIRACEAELISDGACRVVTNSAPDSVRARGLHGLVRRVRADVGWVVDPFGPDHLR